LLALERAFKGAQGWESSDSQVKVVSGGIRCEAHLHGHDRELSYSSQRKLGGTGILSGSASPVGHGAFQQEARSQAAAVNEPGGSVEGSGGKFGVLEGEAVNESLVILISVRDDARGLPRGYRVCPPWRL
jgi:hypothetical protein